MGLLLDTHILIWMARRPDLLSPAERKVLDDAATEPLLSVVSLWEIGLKWERVDRHGARKGEIDPVAALVFATRVGIRTVPLTPEVAAGSLSMPVANADPFDRMLLIHAGRLEARLPTRDGKLRDHPLAFAP